ncbi:tRNA (guanine(9)-N(1))-methyltransferase [Spizellomyces punctatus DAOM BR117]|uniref:tRNA (guanine(9)-N1)-methyltransferase n=1 Tax=Spizellomyces punctatus (strain DAOM BR117) TaxID=645134 RepID=A0A0L0HLH2_SPIPD|nr:tRNA (guanine(9)-N(1))-methyltransferase [Spizellomyces punctatus DAOM BR117]KND01750.1 hypothetical protein SPPG_03544 [Spizellomyces punctatus DAOM BR117]|eukprot:XP_016609789.1 hypothetical protein SPPG_03544 [Spizellomyces punctatus DAOM BR117]
MEATEQDLAPRPDLPTSPATVKNEPNTPTPLSKRAQKRAAKQAKWDAMKEERLEIRKQKRAQVKQMRKEKIKQGLLQPKPRRPPHQDPSPMTIAIDLSFEDKMIKKEIDSTARQIARCYAANKASTKPVHLAFTSFTGQVKQALSIKYRDFERWVEGKCPILYTEDTFTTLSDPSNIVYLTADASTTLTELDETKTYVIGGIVDKNRYKGLCYEQAKAYGLATAKLPLDHYVAMQSRKVLTINHVFEIMIKWLETRDWQQSFLAVLPQRKNVHAKQDDDDDDVHDGVHEGESDFDETEEQDLGDSHENGKGIEDQETGMGEHVSQHHKANGERNVVDVPGPEHTLEDLQEKVKRKVEEEEPVDTLDPAAKRQKP